MRPANITAVLFDVGGVLQILDHQRVQRALAPIATEISEESIDRAHYVALASVTASTQEVRRDEYFAAYFLALGIPNTRKDEAMNLFLEELGDGSGWTKVVPGAARLLRDIADAGLRLAVVSNTMAGGVEDRLRQSGLCQVGTGAGACVDAIIDSQVAGVRKPDPKIFRTALDAVGAEPDQAAFVGDDLYDDIHGAESVGIHAVHFDPLELCPATDHPHARRVNDIAELLGI